MRRIVTWAMSTLTVLVLLFSYNTSRSSTAVVAAETRPVTVSGATSGSTGSARAGAGTGSSSSDTSGTSGASGASAVARTYAGDAAMTRFGDVQVQITVQNGQITAADVLQVPMNDRHDQMINSQAVPIYNQETLSAQSAQIDVVSGATYTWEGYTQSLQSAIDQANL